MTDAIEIEVPAAGAPALEGQDGPPVTEGPDQFAAAATSLMPVPGWTQDEAARVVGGVLANVTLVMYAMRWHAAPAPELWPVIAGDPPREFPLMGAGLAPVLDFLAPKGSAAAVGVSLTAGIGEVIGAMARRWEVVNTAPPTARPAAGPAPAPTPSPAPSGDGAFRFSRSELRVLEDGPLAGLGIE